MRFILNILWVLCGGFIPALGYAVAGLLLCVTLIGIPFGLQCFKIGGLALFPFGKDFDSVESGGMSFLGNVLWVIFAGFWIFLSQLSLALASAVTLIGIPFAFQHLKLAMVALAPFGVRVRTAR